MFRILSLLDRTVIHTLKRYNAPLARVVLFVIFFWFGALKVIAASPANPLIADLLEKTLPFITFPAFLGLFGVFEMIIGVLFLVPKTERLAIVLLALHMIATFLPLVLLPELTWNRFLVPTLEGQYIIKNLAIIALATGVAAHLHPIK